MKKRWIPVFLLAIFCVSCALLCACTSGQQTVTTEVESVTLNKTALALYVGDEFTLEATVSPEDASNKTVDWYSGDEAVVTVSDSGLVKAIGSGTSYVTAQTRDGQKTASCTIKVTEKVTGLSLDKPNIEMAVGNTSVITATVTPASAAGTVVWSCEPVGIVSVSNGTVTAVAAGDAVITASNAEGDKTATCNVKVHPAATSVQVTGTGVAGGRAEIDLEAATPTLQLSATVSPAEAMQGVVWQSGDETIATVSETGLVTGIAAGEVTISATSQDGFAVASVTIVVVGPVDAAVSIASDCDMRGMNLKLQSDTETKTVTVTNENAFALTGVDYGTEYEVIGEVGGLDVVIGMFTVRGGTVEFDPTATIGKGNGGTLDLTNGTYVYKAGAKGGYTFKVAEEVDGDVWAAAKISISADDMTMLTTSTNDAVFGISLAIGSRTIPMHCRLWHEGGQILVGDWLEGNVFYSKDDKTLTERGQALAGDGLWFVAHYASGTGLYETYLGTSPDNITRLRDWGNGETNSFETNAQLKAISVGYLHSWGNSALVGVTFSNVRYGATLGAALGLTENVALTSDSTQTNGTVAVSGKPYENVTLTFTPNADYMFSSVKVNGEDMTSSVSGNTLVLENYTGETVKVEAVFEKILELASVDVTIPSNVKMDGMTLTLTKGGTSTEVQVKDGKFTLTNVTVGDVYAVTATVNGLKTNLGTLTIRKDDPTFDPTAAIGKGNGGTLDLTNGTYVYNAGAKGGYTFTPTGEVDGDMWFAAKIKIDADALANNNGEVLYGFTITIGELTRDIAIQYKTEGGTVTCQGVSEGWCGGHREITEEEISALTGDGLWFVVHYQSSDGRTETYLGTSETNVKLLRDWGNQGGEASFAAEQKLVSYSVGYFHDWGTTAVVGATFSNVKCGASAEALGLTIVKE